MGICRLPGSPPKSEEGEDKKKKEGKEDEESDEEEKKKSQYPHRHIDLRMFNSSHFPCAVLYFTGSDFFNVQMRLLALERGFTLNEYEVMRFFFSSASLLVFFSHYVLLYRLQKLAQME